MRLNEPLHTFLELEFWEQLFEILFNFFNNFKEIVNFKHSSIATKKALQYCSIAMRNVHLLTKKALQYCSIAMRDIHLLTKKVLQYCSIAMRNVNLLTKKTLHYCSTAMRDIHLLTKKVLQYCSIAMRDVHLLTKIFEYSFLSISKTLRGNPVPDFCRNRFPQ